MAHSISIPEPAVSRKALMRSAAVVWGAVGLFLSLRAVYWFAASRMTIWWMVLLALAVGLAKGRFVFSRLARRNVERIKHLSPHKNKICIFAFQAMQSYLIIIGMITLGILLRMSPLPRELLAVIYLAIGAGLVYASGEYWSGLRTQRSLGNVMYYGEEFPGMRFEVLPPRKDHHEFEIISCEHGSVLRSVLIPEAQLFQFTSLDLQHLQLELSFTGIVDHIWGYCPRQSWKEATLIPPDAVNGGVRVVTAAPLQAGASRIGWRREREHFYDSDNCWLCTGDPEAREDFRISIVPSLILVFTEKEILAVWTKIARFEG